MAVTWTCPHCNTNWHSAWPRREQKTVKCECGADIDNPYYGDDALDLGEPDEVPFIFTLTKVDIRVILCKAHVLMCDDCPAYGIDGWDQDACRAIKEQRDKVFGRLKGAVGI